MSLKECNTLYNIVGHPNQIHFDNIFILSDDLHMIDIQYSKDSDPEYFLKMKKILNDQNPETVELIKDKYELVI